MQVGLLQIQVGSRPVQSGFGLQLLLQHVIVFQSSQQLPPFHRIALVCVQRHDPAGDFAGDAYHHLGFHGAVAVNLGGEVAFLDVYHRDNGWG